MCSVLSASRNQPRTWPLSHAAALFAFRNRPRTRAAESRLYSWATYDHQRSPVSTTITPQVRSDSALSAVSLALPARVWPQSGLANKPQQTARTAHGRAG